VPLKLDSKGQTIFLNSEVWDRAAASALLLFNIYINELADLLKQSDSPGLQLLHMEVKYLLYADDLIILSKTPEGLQNNLNILTKYCHDWKLEVNIPKTKIMIFQKKKQKSRT